MNFSSLGGELFLPSFYQRSYHKILRVEESARLRESSDSSNFNLDLDSVQFDLTNEVKYLNRRVNCRVFNV